MPKVILLFKDIKIREYPFVTGQPLTIGRKHSNDIVIDNPAVSGNHAQIEQVATTYILRDLNSTNGTYIDEKQIETHMLKHNDLILIGNHKLLFDLSDKNTEESKVREDYDIGKTRFLNVRSYHDLSKKNAQDAADSAGDKAAQPSFFKKLLKAVFG